MLGRNGLIYPPLPPLLLVLSLFQVAFGLASLEFGEHLVVVAVDVVSPHPMHCPHDGRDEVSTCLHTKPLPQRKRDEQQEVNRLKEMK
jgi:hypothetical protein